jgi:hypothetical protein
LAAYGVAQSWNDNDYKYRSLIKVDAAGYKRQNKQVEVRD